VFSCLADQTPVGGRFRLHGLLDKSEEQLATMTGRAAIEPEREFIKVVVQMVMAYSALMCPQKPTLQPRYHAMNPRKKIGGRFLSTPKNRHLVGISFLPAGRQVSSKPR